VAEDRIGLFFALGDDPELVAFAEDAGYHSAWAAEGQGKSAFGKLERWAVATDRIRLATGIVNVFSRTPAMLASDLATLDAHSDGRAVLGLGVAHPGVVETFHGVPFERPLPRLKEYVELVRRYLAGEASGYDGEFYSPERTSFWGAFEPVRGSVPIYNAALGPSNLRLTGRVADGWFPNLYPKGGIERGRELIREGAEAVGRDPADVTVAPCLLAAVDDDPAVARDAVADHVVTYMRDVPGYYDQRLAEMGFEEEVSVVMDAPSSAVARDRIPADLLEAVAVWGTEETARERLDGFRNAGVDLPVIRVPSSFDRAATERVIRTLEPGR